MLPYYYSVSEYLKDTYGKKLYKLSLSGNMNPVLTEMDFLIQEAVYSAVVMVPEILPLKILTKQRLWYLISILAVNILHISNHLLTHMLMPNICVNFLCL